MSDRKAARPANPPRHCERQRHSLWDGRRDVHTLAICQLDSVPTWRTRIEQTVSRQPSPAFAEIGLDALPCPALLGPRLAFLPPFPTCKTGFDHLVFRSVSSFFTFHHQSTHTHTHTPSEDTPPQWERTSPSLPRSSSLISRGALTVSRLLSSPLWSTSTPILTPSPPHSRPQGAPAMVRCSSIQPRRPTAFPLTVLALTESAPSRNQVQGIPQGLPLWHARQARVLPYLQAVLPLWRPIHLCRVCL